MRGEGCQQPSNARGEETSTKLESVLQVPLVGPDFRDDHAVRRGKRFMFFQVRKVKLFMYNE